MECGHRPPPARQLDTSCAPPTDMGWRRDRRARGSPIVDRQGAWHAPASPADLLWGTPPPMPSLVVRRVPLRRRDSAGEDAGGEHDPRRAIGRTEQGVTRPGPPLLLAQVVRQPPRAPDRCITWGPVGERSQRQSGRRPRPPSQKTSAGRQDSCACISGGKHELASFLSGRPCVPGCHDGCARGSSSGRQWQRQEAVAAGPHVLVCAPAPSPPLYGSRTGPRTEAGSQGGPHWGRWAHWNMAAFGPGREGNRGEMHAGAVEAFTTALLGKP